MPYRPGTDPNVSEETEEIYMEMLRLHCSGKTHKEIGIKLKYKSLSIATGLFYLRKKYEAKNTAQLIMILVRQGKLK